MSSLRKSDILSTIDRCNNCEKRVGTSRLRQCSGCHLVRYCSKECQRNHWLMHKASCKIGTETRRMEAENPVFEGENHAIMKWLSYWRGTLFEFGIHAMDLANYSIDRMSTHVLFLEFEFRAGEAVEKHRALKLRAGLVIPRSRFVTMMNEQRISPSFVEHWKQDIRGPDTLQIVLVCSSNIRNLWGGIRSAELQRLCDGDKQQSRIHGETWAQTLREMIDFGSPTGFPGGP